MKTVNLFANARNKSRTAILVSALLAVWTQSACIPLQQKASDGTYEGLNKRLNMAVTNEANVHFLMVHGMGDHCPGEWDPFLASIAQELKLVSNNVTTKCLPSSLEGITNELRIFDFSLKNSHLFFYELTWTPTTLPYKSKSFAKDRSLGPGRLLLDRSVKHDVLDEGFGDAVLYLNPKFRAMMQEPILQSLKIVSESATNEDDQIVLMTHSLGSIMTFDTITSHVRTNSTYTAALKNFAKKTTDIIMFANQIPLINLGFSTDITGLPEPGVRDNPAKSFIQLSQRQKFESLKSNNNWKVLNRKAMTDFLQINVVAATDPNDLLSWPLSTNDILPDPDLSGAMSATNNVGEVVNASTNISLVNVYSHNTYGILWIAENPETAHNNYQKNAWLIRHVIRGFSIKPAFITPVPETFSCPCECGTVEHEEFVAPRNR